MVNHISTYTTSNGIFSQTQRLQATYATVTEQSSSGVKADSYEGVSDVAQRLLSANTDSSTLTAQGLVIQAAQTRINALQNVVGSVSDTLNQANSLLTSVLSGTNITSGATSNVEEATTIRDELASLLNTQVGGSYLFGGTVTDTPPVDLSASTYNPTSFSTADTGYYQGDNTLDTVRTSNSLSITYGVTANNPAFEQAFRALNLFIANPTDTATAQSAFDMIKTSLAGVGDITGSLTSKANIIDSQASINTASAAYQTQVISGLRDVDTAAAAVQATQLETQLQASYAALSKLLNLRLSDYLK